MPETTTIMTQWMPPRKARAVNYTTNGFPPIVPQAAAPVDDDGTASGRSSINARNGGYSTQNVVKIQPYAVASDNGTFSMRVYGWQCLGNDPATQIWIPTLLCEVLCTADSTLAGLAGRLVVATEIFCDTIAIVGTSGNPNVSVEIVSPADGVSVAHLVVDTKGSERIECTFTTGGSATSCNAILSQF